MKAQERRAFHGAGRQRPDSSDPGEVKMIKAQEKVLELRSGCWPGEAREETVF